MSIDDITKEEWDKVRDIKPDMVDRPKHYQGKIQCIELIKDRVGASKYPAYIEGNIWKYLYRHKDKQENIQDLKKCQWYLNELIKHYEEL
jgi:arylamine N-acetyltransferase